MGKELIKFIYLSLFIFICTTSVQATIYVGFTDIKTGSNALAVITSGPIYSKTTIISAKEDSGLIGWSGRGRVSNKADKLIFKMMAENKSKEEISQKINTLYPNAYYRLLFLTPNGEVGSLIPKNGCPAKECGEKVREDFIILGGGLEKDVLEKTFLEFDFIAYQPKHIACRMLDVLKYIVKVGGEKKRLRTAQIVVDSNEDKILWANSLMGDPHHSESKILSNLSDNLLRNNIDCR